MNNSNVINLQNLKNENQESGLSATIRTALTQYLDDLDGENPGNIYDMVIQQVEAPLLELILQHVEGNLEVLHETVTHLGQALLSRWRLVNPEPEGPAKQKHDKGVT